MEEKIMIKLVEVIDELEMGGAQHVLYEIISHLDKSKFNITIICFKKAEHTASFVEDQVISEGYRVIYLKAKKRSWKYIELMFVLCQLRPQIIHAHQTGIVAALWGIIFHVKTIVSIHTKPEKAFLFPIAQRAYRIAQKAHAVITVAISAYNRELCRKFWNLSENEVRYVNKGIAIERFKRVSHSQFSFINVGRQDENKNQILIIRAFEKFVQAHPEANVTVQLVGNGDSRSNLEKTTEELKLTGKIIFVDYVSNPEKYIEQADVYVSSSHREGLSLSVLESMAAGLPVIATDAGGVRELAQANGILIADDDEKALTTAMSTLFENKNIWMEKSKASLEIVQQYSSEQMAAEYTKLFEKFTKK